MHDRPAAASGPRIIVALDYASAEAALACAARLSPTLCRLKVGMELYTAAGRRLVEELIDQGFDIFLDLKYHDIPTTVAKACDAAARLGVWMLNVHTLGGYAMLQAARDAVDTAPRHPLLVGVTLLTSHGSADLLAIGLPADARSQVERLAGLAHKAGLDGVVCSAQEARKLRTKFGAGFVLVTPGIRPAGSPLDDQQRVLTPLEAMEQGSDYLVIGRPITQAYDPQRKVQEIQRDIENFSFPS